MNILIRSLYAALFALFSSAAPAQDFPNLQVSFATPISANTPFSIVATSRGLCLYPYPENQRPPDFVLNGNELDMTVYLLFFGENITPIPPCLNRTQIYTAPALQPGTYRLKLNSRFYRNIDGGSFASPIRQGELIFEVAGAVPVTQIPATSGWSLALLLLGMLGAVRWVSVHSGR